ncbi:MAG: undecaprenyldiphospho-muramoylpentapeptide beta-N-acetylglucosaminyltransferase [Rhizobiales bacterium]|nr:undecaprenyldiphospho-muramoylpentapeptide beta-N-acetylglucosaminyltransferase [Hyphomicrobiales bacterium]
MSDGAKAPLILLAAGGTGGHLFPAEALANVLVARGFRVDLVTDHRVSNYLGKFPAGEVHVVSADTLRGGNPFRLALTLFRLGFGTLRSIFLLRKLKPAAVVGFGGYPTLPPMFAAKLLFIPTVIHDANAVMGRANRLVAKFASAIATGYPRTVQSSLERKATRTGNPVRPAVVAAAQQEYPALSETSPIKLVVFGGSQGARVMSEIVPGALGLLEEKLHPRLEVIQQCREEDLAATETVYRRLGIKAELAPFFSGLPEKIAASHLVIARSGASTVSELAAIGRPSVLVPLPHAIDNDQLANAASLAAAGGAIVIRQNELTPEGLASELTGLFTDLSRLPAMAKAAKAEGRLDAAERLADLVMKVAGVAP